MLNYRLELWYRIYQPHIPVETMSRGLAQRRPQLESYINSSQNKEIPQSEERGILLDY